MYPFAHLRDAYDELWAAVAARLPDAPAALDREVDLSTAWHSPDLLVAQTCGWPLVSELADEVEVIGAFDVRAPFAAECRYRSVLVAAKPLGIEVWKQDPATVVAQNGPASLSGWVSMLWAWGGTPPNVLHTGGHVLSMRAVAAGEAQVASIDALSFEFLAETERATVGRLHVIGHGPLVGTLPLVMSKALAHRRDEVRAAFAAAVTDPSSADACARLRINAFVPVGLDHYASLGSLVPPPAS
jgi:ABC-type phosphate/phosphonate transport system substrate-binding protein